MELRGLKYLIVGSGLFGSVIAERIANDMGEKVLVIDKRSHVGGNCYSEGDESTGIEVHNYGSHIFHTSIESVWNYITKFCSFNNYRHKVLIKYKNKVYYMPINLGTINSYFGTDLNPSDAKNLLHEEIIACSINEQSNLEDKAISQIGKSLYDAFIRGYTKKHWGLDPKLLPPEIITRLQVRFNYNIDYFDDLWQGIPKNGYSDIFNRLLNHPNIRVLLKTDYATIQQYIPVDCKVIYSGPIDQFFNFKYGNLGWRSVYFEKEVIDSCDFQGTAVMNYADEAIPYTRTHEFRHYHPERDYSFENTIVYHEYSTTSSSNDEPYYPINTYKDCEILKLYRNEASKLDNVIFGGRLGAYKYLDMDKTVNEALNSYYCFIRK